MLATLRGVLHEATAAFEDYEHARALDLLERFFWSFTDFYLELVKQRAYGDGAGAASAVAALRQALDVQLRAFAPFLPYVTEEVWSWWREGSIHRSSWPEPEELAGADDGDPEVFAVTAWVLREVRKEKALAKVSLKVPAARVVVRAPRADLDRIELARGDLCAAGAIESLELVEAAELSVEVELGGGLSEAG
jgi:valyl-tRNA synthetase